MKEIINVFPKQLQHLCKKSFQKEIEPEEIRLRIGQPVMIIGKAQEYFWNLEMGVLEIQKQAAYCWKEEDMRETLSHMSQYSMYALEEEIRRGFFTMEGGHRIGIVGKTVCEQGKIVAMRNISGLNIRIAREKRGCAKKMLSYIKEGEELHNTLILSPPGIGKTTMLRDCIRILSNGDEKTVGKKVGVVDERSEIAASFQGIPQNDLGIRTDVLDCCPKAEGMRLLLRSMSPQVIAVDELGSKEDYRAVEEVLHCGCKILGTMHIGSIDELKEKVYLSDWLDRGFFERFVFLKRNMIGEREFEIYDGALKKIC